MHRVVSLLALAAAVTLVHSMHTLTPEEREDFLGRVADSRPHYRQVQQILGHDQPHRNRVVLLSQHMIDTKEHPAFLEHPEADRLGFARADDTTEHQYLVHLRGGAGEAVKAELSQALGTPLGRYVPKNTYVLVAPPAVAMRAAALPQVAWVGPLLPEHRISSMLVEAHREWQSLSEEEQSQHAVSTASHWEPAPGNGRRAIDSLSDQLHVELSASAEAGALRAARVVDKLRAEHPELSYEVVTGVAHADVINVGNVGFDVRTDIVVWLAHLPEVAWIEPKVVFRVTNSHSRVSTQSGEVQDGGGTPIWDHGLHGEGQFVGVGDSGIDTGHCAFNQGGKVKSNVAFAAATLGDEAGGHGTHVSGSVAGFQTQGGDSGHGAAYEATIVFNDIGVEVNGVNTGLSVPDPLDDPAANGYFTHAYGQGARIHTNSWGARTGDYLDNARAVDAFSKDNEDFLILFAAGNDGEDGGNTILLPGNSKNGLAIGAGNSDTEHWQHYCDEGEFGDPSSCTSVIASNSDNYSIQSIAGFSSRGPTNDGRIKPDVTCPGHYIWSADAGTTCDFFLNLGTSMACPTCAGVTALMRQYLTEGWYPTGKKTAANEQANPDGVLLKTMMVNAGVWMTGQRNLVDMPNPQEFNEYAGFGRVEADEVLFFDKSTYSSYLASNSVSPISKKQTEKTELATGEETEICFPVDATRPLRISMCWMDAPGGAGASWLINDLDMIVEDPSGKMYYGNKQSQFNGDLISNSAGDRLNTCEKVVVDNPEAGTWCVTVKAIEVNSGSTQAFALVASGGGNLSPARRGLSPWDIVLIVLGSLALLGLLGAGAIFFVKRSSAEPEYNNNAKAAQDKSQFAGASVLTADQYAPPPPAYDQYNNRATGMSEMTAYQPNDGRRVTGATTMTYTSGNRSRGNRSRGNRSRGAGGSRGNRSRGAGGSRGGRSAGSRGKRSGGARAGERSYGSRPR